MFKTNFGFQFIYISLYISFKNMFETNCGFRNQSSIISARLEKKFIVP